MDDDTCIHDLRTGTCSICIEAPSNQRHPVVAPPPSPTAATVVRSSVRQCPKCRASFTPRDTATLDYPRCAKVARLLRVREERRFTSPPRQPWTLGFELKAWQAAALQEWTKAGQRGVVEAATGTGKTVVALAAIECLHREHGNRLRVAIVVPTKVLAHQWRDQLERRLGLPRDAIGEHHSDARVEWRPEQPVLVAVINSARTSLPPVLEGWRKRGHLAFLVVDECHRAGSEYNAQIFEGSYDLSLGLSATPERGDWGHEEFVYPGLGRPVYRYQLLDALDEGVLAPVRSVNLYVDFDADEHERWQELSDHLGTAFRNLMDRYPELGDVADDRLLGEVGKLAKGQDRLALSILKLLADRRELLSSARARSACQRSVLSWLAETGHRTLVFHETIAAAEASHQHLARTLRVRAGLDHSQLHRQQREEAMEGFRSGRHQVLVAVRALDEGVDVPDASVAVIAGGSRSRRQRIQRFGRVLRHGEGKEALVITVLVRATPEEVAVGGQDGVLPGVDRVRHHRWPGTPVDLAIDDHPSTYRPGAPKLSADDALTLGDLGLLEPGMAADDLWRRSGHDAPERYFSPNRWYPADEVSDRMGIPRDEFDRLRRSVRKAFQRRLDPRHLGYPTLIYGSEIEAVRRQWHQRERARTRTGRR